MTLSAFILILFSAFLHAGWNFLSKKTIPSLAFYAISTMAASVFWLPFSFFMKVNPLKLPWQFWLLLLASIGFEIIYFVGLAQSYRRSDISFVYPLARAIPVLLTALITIVCGFGKSPSSMALVGMLVLSSGCILMPLESWKGFSFAVYRTGIILFILVAATGTTGYTIVDSEVMKVFAEAVPGASPTQRAIFYLFIMETGLSLGMNIIVFFNRRERSIYKKLFLKRIEPLVSGVASSMAYVLVLMAMGLVSNVSYVQAFRQMSLPLGVMLGIVFLKERPRVPRLVGIALVVLGLVAVAIG